MIGILPRLRLLLLLIACFAINGCACTCTPPPLDYDLEHSSTIFSGTVRSQRFVDGRFESTFAIDAGWKGMERRSIRIIGGKDNGECGYPFQLGRRYLVFAEGSWQPSATICSNTTELPNPTLQRRLGPPLWAPTSAPTPMENLLVALSALVAISLIAMVLVRRKRLDIRETQ